VGATEGAGAGVGSAEGVGSGEGWDVGVGEGAGSMEGEGAGAGSTEGAGVGSAEGAGAGVGSTEGDGVGSTEGEGEETGAEGVVSGAGEEDGEAAGDCAGGAVFSAEGAPQAAQAISRTKLSAAQIDLFMGPLPLVIYYLLFYQKSFALTSGGKTKTRNLAVAGWWERVDTGRQEPRFARLRPEYPPAGGNLTGFNALRAGGSNPPN